MSDKDKATAAAIMLLVKEGFEVTYEALPIGKIGNGVHLHVVDEITLIKGKK